MRSFLTGLIGVTAFVVALNFTPVYAQTGTDKEGGPAAGGAAVGSPETGGPKGAPSVPQAQESGPGDQGMTPGKEKGKSAAKRTDETVGEKPKGKSEKSADKPAADKGEGTAESKAKEGKTADNPAKDNKGDKASGKEPGTAESEGKSETTGKHSKAAKIEPEQEEKVKSYFIGHKPTVKRVERSAVSVSVGIAIPGSIALYPVPSGVVVLSADCPLEYFVWEDDIVLVDSCSREVVDVIPGAA